MITVNKYQKATAKLIEKLLREAERMNLDLDKMLNKISEESLDEVIKELQQLEKNGKINLKQGINLRDNPNIYKVLKEIEAEIWHKFTEWTWIGYQIMTESFASMYQTTAQSTYEIFKDVAPFTNQFAASQSIRSLSGRPRVKIVDTYNTKELIQIPWCKDGKTYSQRLYSNVANFESKLAFVLEEGLTKGKGIEWMQQAWRKLTGSAAYETARLIKTETMAFWGESTKRTYLDMGIEYVEIVNGSECAEICSEFVDGEPIPLAEAEVGGVLPPYHPNCCCSFVAYIAETDKKYIDEG